MLVNRPSRYVLGMSNLSFGVKGCNKSKSVYAEYNLCAIAAS